MEYDVAIIGGGPAGYTAAERAACNGLKTILFEKDNIGGVCLNEGCVPTKTLLYSAKLLDNAKNASKYGIQLGSATYDLDKIISRKNKVVRKLAAGVKQRLNAAGVDIINREARLSSSSQDGIIIYSEGIDYKAKNVLLCTGSETIIPPIKGLSDIQYWTSREALESKEIPKSLVIIGGGVIGIEFASFFNSLGVEVSVVEMLPEILGNMDKELSALLRTEYIKKGIKFYLNTKVVEVKEGQVIIQIGEELQVLSAEKIMLSTGRRPKTENLGLDTLSIVMRGRGIEVNEYMQTSHPNVYACGDIIGYSLLAHTAVHEGETAINHILGKNHKMSYKAIPSVVYTNPEFASVGATETTLKAAGIDYTIKKLPMAFSGRFVAENEMGTGFCKILIDSQNKIVGCHILGNPSSELIVIAGMAIEKGYDIKEFCSVIFPHPTVGEIIHETLLS